MAYTHTMTITTDNPVDAKGVQAFIDACGYLMTGFLGKDATIHATWNDGGEVTPEQVKRFGVKPADAQETVAALAGTKGEYNPYDALFGDADIDA